MKFLRSDFLNEMLLIRFMMHKLSEETFSLVNQTDLFL